MKILSITIIADSACDLPLSYLEEHQVAVFPLMVHLNDEQFEDLITIQPLTVYEAMRNGQAPVTSQASPQRMKDTFQQIAKNNGKAIYIAFSSELSGTYQTAVMMLEQVKEDYPHCDITIIDTRSASLGYGLIVKNAIKLAKEKKTKEEIIKSVYFYRDHMEHLFTVDNLDYLARGGRLSKASAFVGGLLNIKPLLNVEDGKLIPLEKIRGRKKVLRRIIDIMEERGVALNKQIVGISHGDDEETALEMKRAIQKRFGTTKFFINTVGSVIGAHAGPGTIAIFFLNKLPAD